MTLCGGIPLVHVSGCYRTCRHLIGKHEGKEACQSARNPSDWLMRATFEGKVKLTSSPHSKQDST